MKMKRHAFTLIELLVAIGIVCVLIGILLPVVSRARGQAHRVECISNLRQIGAGFTGYTMRYDGYLPATAPKTNYSGEDWIAWRSGGPGLNASSLAPFVSTPVQPKLFRCPAEDDVDARAYPYSYVMNAQVCTDATPRQCMRILKIKSISEKILVYEEDQRTIDDGSGDLAPGPNMGLLSIRHDRTQVSPDTVGVGNTAMTTNIERQGNVLFVDWHVDYVSRKFAHDPAHYTIP